MNKMIQADDVYYEYITENEDEFGVQAVNGVSLSIDKGDYVVVLGRNGSGKSTLARLFNGLLLPRKGTIYVGGISTSNDELIWDVRRTLGLVLQNPDNQIVSTTVEEDVAFGPENLGVAPKEIRKKVDESLALVGMEEYAQHSPHQLSGGQKQRIAIAGILAMEPECIVLDEATSMLDPHGRNDVIETLRRLNKDRGITIVLITHHMDEAVGADKVFVMEGGRIILNGTPAKIFEKVDLIRSSGLDVPQVTALAYGLKQDGLPIKNLPLTIEEMVELLKELKRERLPNTRYKALKDSPDDLYGASAENLPNLDLQPIITVRSLSHTYMEGSTFEQRALQDVNLTVNRGEVLGIIGQTGSGKSTLVQHFNGILKPTSGTLDVDGLKAEGKELKELRQKVGLIFQYPEHQLFEETVYKDIIFGLNKNELTEDEIKERVFRVTELLGIDPEILEKSPFELSGGQKRRVAIAGVLVMKPEVIVLDEPTAGLDPQGSLDVFRILSTLNKEENTTIIIISHNMEEIAEYCNRVAVMHKGRLVACDTSRTIFSKHEVLKSYSLDIPRITKLCIELKNAGFDIPAGILTVDESRRYIRAIIDNYTGGVSQ